MPEEGFKSITVSDEVYAQLQKLAEKNCRSVSREVEHLLKIRKREA